MTAGLGVRAGVVAAVMSVCCGEAAAQTFNCKIPIPTLKERMIEESIARYPGNCPCPYFRDRAGRQCGKRSAWSRGGGYAPLCYPADISPDMVREFCEVLKMRGEKVGSAEDVAGSCYQRVVAKWTAKEQDGVGIFNMMDCDCGTAH